MQLADFFIINIDNEYVLNETLDVTRYFKSTSVLAEIQERIPFVEKQLKKPLKH
ncbi:MAG: hypothetical protein R2807_03900 [Chitinophagales bacterium]